MPFTASLNFVYEVIRDVVDSERLECHRVDESGISTPIVDDIKRWLANADLVIADLTGKNPNVYYEVGFAHAIGKKVILIAQSFEDLSLDVRFIRAFVYTTPEDLRHTLVKAIRETL
jgi:nucleoside 2-deoxyribosyltransferase